MADAKNDDPDDAAPAGKPEPAAKRAKEPAKETGGRGGLDPTRYGDWEKDGRAIDF